MIKFIKLSRPIKMGKESYNWCLLKCKDQLSKESYKELIDMIASQSVKGFYHGYGAAILFQDKTDAEYFTMQAAFIKSREPEKPQVTKINWKSQHYYNLQIQTPGSTFFNTTSV